MGIFEIIIIGVALAMDATAIAISNGMVEVKMSFNKIFAIAFCFGIFQGLMPIFGYYFGNIFADYFDRIDNFVVAFILVFLGIRMLTTEDTITDDCLTCPKILFQGLLTSIDALMLGVTFAIMHVSIYKASLLIAIITTIMCFIGVIFGSKIGKCINKKPEIIGAIILIILAIKIFIEGII